MASHLPPAAVDLIAVIHTATHQNLGQPKKTDQTCYRQNQIHPLGTTISQGAEWETTSLTTMLTGERLSRWHAARAKCAPIM